MVLTAYCSSALVLALRTQTEKPLDVSSSCRALHWLVALSETPEVLSTKGLHNLYTLPHWHIRWHAVINCHHLPSIHLTYDMNLIKLYFDLTSSRTHYAVSGSFNLNFEVPHTTLTLRYSLHCSKSM